MRSTRPLLGGVLPVALVILWELLAKAGFLDPTALPAPSGVVTAAVQEASSGRLIEAVTHSLVVIAVGWLAGVVIGVVVGVTTGLLPPLRILTTASIDFARSIPAVALVPVGVLIFGFELRAEWFVVVFAALWPTVVTTTAAVAMVPQQLRSVATTLRLSPWSRTRKIILPAAMPRILIGMRLSMATAIVLTIVAEMTGNPAGVGYELVMAQNSVRPDTAMCYVVLTGLLGLLLNALLGLAERRRSFLVKGASR